jgi:hypothetical protein
VPALVLLDDGPSDLSHGIGEAGLDGVSLSKLLVDPVPELQSSFDVLFEANSDGVVDHVPEGGKKFSSLGSRLISELDSLYGFHVLKPAVVI